MIVAVFTMGQHMDWDDGDDWWMATMMIVFGIAVLAVIVFAVVMVTRSHQTSTASPARAETAREILDQRFARGEVDVDEYRARRRALE